MVNNTTKLERVGAHVHEEEHEEEKDEKVADVFTVPGPIRFLAASRRLND